MSLPKYGDYKNSGVDWLGDVPTHWTIGPLKRRFEVCLGKMLQPDSSAETDLLKPYLRAANIQWRGVDITDIKSMWFSPKDIEQLRLKVNDLLVSEGGDVGRSATWEGQLDECYIQNSVNRIRAKADDSTNFLYYWIVTIKGQGYIDVLCNKSTIAHFTAEKVAEVTTPFPPPSEQHTIAAFLDRETANIDALIAEQEKLIALLAEKRQATISHAVTLGLNPNAAMKDSGVAWLGEVPAHWTLSKIRYFTHFIGGGTPSRENLQFWNGDIPWVSPKDMKTEQIENTEECITRTGLENSSTSLIDPGQVLMVVRSGILKHTIPVAINMVAVSLNQDMKALKFEPTICDVRFFLRWVQGLNDHLLLAWAKQGATVESIEHSYLGNTIIPLPPITEQIAIAAFLDLETSKIDELKIKAERAIYLLKERRSALITAAVTGQIDVRGLVEPQLS